MEKPSASTSYVEDPYESVEREEFEDRLSRRVNKRHLGEDSAAGRDQQAWHGSAFVLEAVILLFFISISLAIITNLFGTSHQTGQDANDLTHGLILATTESVNGAEAFAANPTDTQAPEVAYYQVDDGRFIQAPIYTSGVYVVKRTVTTDNTDAGTLYKAHIEVSRFDNLLYELDTEAYVSERRS